MRIKQLSWHTAWHLFACILAAFIYFYGLDSQHIPKNGDEYPYEHITRLTAESGALLPLQSQMDNMRNTKPPLLFWQGIATTDWGGTWTLWNLRYPSVIYTLLTAVLLFFLGRKLSTSAEPANRAATGFVAALTFLAFFTTYRFGRPFLTNAPEVFWLFLPFFVLLYWRQAFASQWLVPLLLGISFGISFLYKSFALGLPVTLGLASWYLHQRQYLVPAFLKQDLLKIAITLVIAVGLFSLWFVLDPDPQAVWNEFVLGENVGKFDPHGQSYLSKLLWGGSSIWSYAMAFLSNPGLLIFPVVGLFFVAFKRRKQWSNEEKLLWIWIAVMFLSFSLPSQRSGRYLLAAMPAVALLCALNWQQISRKAFIASLVFAFMIMGGIIYLAARLEMEFPDLQLYPLMAWLLMAGTPIAAIVAIVIPSLTRPGTNLVALLVVLSFAVILRPFDGELGNFSETARQYAKGKTVWVPCNFRAMDEGHRFILPGANIHGYSEDQNLTTGELATRYPIFIVRQNLNAASENNVCPDCKIIGQRLDIRGRQTSNEIKEMLFKGKIFQHLFVKETLMESSETMQILPSQTLAQRCR